MKVDINKDGLSMVFFDWQVPLIKHMFKTGDEITSREALDYVNNVMIAKELSKISRASVINLLNSMNEEGLLRYRKETCKGGFRRVYKATMNEHQFWKELATKTHEKINEAADDQLLTIVY